MTVEVHRLGVEHAGELLTVQRAAYVTEAQRYGDPMIAPLTESLDEVIAALRSPRVLAFGAWHGPRLVGAVRLTVAGPVAHLGRLVVAPDRQGLGIGGALMDAAEHATPSDVTEIRLFTGAGSADNLRLYERHGYRRLHEDGAGPVPFIHLSKPV